MVRLEIEVKIKITRETEIRGRLEKAGARLVHDREFEDNRLYDFPDRALMSRGAMLRIRVLERGAILTYKGAGRVEGGKKVREETETSLARSEAGPLAEILGKMGMVQIFHYQKFRTTWEIEGLHLTLDETPIGDYLELEGEPETIDAVSRALGYTPVDYISASYRDLYMNHRHAQATISDEMVFAQRTE